jgi:hypothetical protein
MKKIIAVVLAFVMLALMCSCEQLSQQASTDSDLESTSTKNVTTSTKAPEPAPADPTPDEPVLKDVNQSTYLSSKVSSQMEQYFKNDFYHFSAYGVGGAPYALQDVFTISNARVLSITIPVYSVGAADANGDYIFTLYVMESTRALLMVKTS